MLSSPKNNITGSFLRKLVELSFNMKRGTWNILSLIMLFASALMSLPLQAQEDSIVNVGAGEYCTSYVTKSGRVYITKWDGKNYRPADVGLNDIVDVDGAQYTNVVMNKRGEVFIIGLDRSRVKIFIDTVSRDASGALFNGNSKVYGWYQTYLSIRNGNIWYWGVDIIDRNRNGSVSDMIARPLKLNQPAGKTIVKLVVLTLTQHTLMAMASDGSVWTYTSASADPVRISLPSPARDIAGVGAAAFVVETKNDLLAWGILANYLGLGYNTLKPTSILAKWKAAGCVFPSKQLVGNYNTLHIVDANNNLFGAGDNVMGEIGNGDEWPSWRNYKTFNKVTPFSWSWSHAERLVSNPVKIPGKVKNIRTSNTITFYLYLQDMANNWYSWGRNKSRCLGNGITLAPNDEAKYPNFRDVTAPNLVTPLKQEWTVLPPFDPNASQPPQANAGINQYISANSTTLYGQGSSQQEGSIISYSWTKISGPECSIVNPRSKNTTVKDLKNGIYVFRLMIENSKKISASADVRIEVDPRFKKSF